MAFPSDDPSPSPPCQTGRLLRHAGASGMFFSKVFRKVSHCLVSHTDDALNLRIHCLVTSASFSSRTTGAPLKEGGSFGDSPTEQQEGACGTSRPLTVPHCPHPCHGAAKLMPALLPMGTSPSSTSSCFPGDWSTDSCVQEVARAWSRAFNSRRVRAPSSHRAALLSFQLLRSLVRLLPELLPLAKGNMHMKRGGLMLCILYSNKRANRKTHRMNSVLHLVYLDKYVAFRSRPLPLLCLPT